MLSLRCHSTPFLPNISAHQMIENTRIFQFFFFIIYDCIWKWWKIKIIFWNEQRADRPRRNMWEMEESRQSTQIKVSQLSDERQRKKIERKFPHSRLSSSVWHRKQSQTFISSPGSSDGKSLKTFMMLRVKWKTRQINQARRRAVEMANWINGSFWRTCRRTSWGRWRGFTGWRKVSRVTIYCETQQWWC